MNLKSFYEYLDSCFFQTIQMENTKYLHLKKKGLPWIGAHCSCLLDEYFREKNTVDGKTRKRTRKTTNYNIKHQSLLDKGKGKLGTLKSEIGHKFISYMDKMSFLKKTKRFNKKDHDLSSFSNLDKDHKVRKSYTSMVESSDLQSHNKGDGGELSSKTERENSSEDDGHSKSRSQDNEFGSSNSELQSSLFADESLNSKNIHHIESLKKRQGNNNVSMPKLLKRFTERDGRNAPDISNTKGVLIQNMLKEEEKKIETLKQERRILDQKEAKKYKLPRITIEAIEFGWILNDNEGKDFLKEITKVEGTELFQLRIIRLIVLFLWRHYSKRLNLLLLLPSFIYLGLYVGYSTWIHQEKMDESKEEGFYHVLNIIMMILLLILTTYFVVIELLHFCYHQSEYFLLSWKLQAWTTYILTYVTIIFDIWDISERAIIPIFAV